MLLRSIFLLGCCCLTSSVARAQPTPFREVAEQVGLDFVHFNGMSGQLHTAEITGSGVALLDVDNDGDLDVYLGQGTMIDRVSTDQLTIRPPHPAPWTDRVFENRLEASGGQQGWRFVDVSRDRGLEITTAFNMGLATGDFDNDGWTDLYVTNLGDNLLLRNVDGRFVDVTAEAGANDRRWSVPASFFDFDADGWLDLFVGNYHRFSSATRKTCYLPNGAPDYCGPLAQPAEPDRLLRNRGDGTFVDVTVRSGLGEHVGTALGSVAADFDNDGVMDLYVANDQLPNQLWMGRGDGTFVEDALLRGVALDQQGRAQASMGVVAEDFNQDGSLDLFMTHVEREYNTLYLNGKGGFFQDSTPASGTVSGSWSMTGFGVVSLDYDLDGVLDLFVANGAVHRSEEQARAGSLHPLGMKNQLFRGTGGGKFEEVGTHTAGPALVEVSRAVAKGDLDNDGDIDLVVGNNAGPARILLNQADPSRDRWIGVRLIDARYRRDDYGASAALRAPATAVEGESPRSLAGMAPSWKRVHTDGSFAAASDPRLLFHLGEDRKSPTLLVRWSDGTKERFDGLPKGEYSTLERGSGEPALGPGLVPRNEPADE